MARIAFGAALLLASTFSWAQVSLLATDITLPPCDVQITPATGLERANGAERVYCVTPGDYGTGEEFITASGTAANPRYLRYYDPADPNDVRHPLYLTVGERAIKKGRLTIQGSNWVITGLAWDMPQDGRALNSFGGENVLVDKILTEGGGGGAGTVRLGTGWKLQSSVIRDTFGDGVPSNSDFLCVLVQGGSDNVEIVGNEIYNCKSDAVHIHPGMSTNMLIADNDLYQEPGFAFGESEQAIDFKLDTGDTEATGVRVYGNRAWGINNDDLGVNNQIFIWTRRDNRQGLVVFRNNIFSDTPRGLSGGNRSEPDNTSIVNNLFYQVDSPFLLRSYSDTEVYYNTVVDADTWISDAGGGAATDTDILCNVIIDGTAYEDLSTGTVADYNAYYNSQQYAAPGTNDVVQGTAAAAANTQFCYDRKRWTGPETHCIPNAITTPASPHANMCTGANVGARAGIGVDDATLDYPDAGVVEALLRGEEPEPPPPGGEPAFATTPGCKLTFAPPFIQCYSIEFAPDCTIDDSQTVPSGITIFQSLCDTITIDAGITLTVNGTFLFPDLLGNPPDYEGAGSCVGTGCN